MSAQSGSVSGNIVILVCVLSATYCLGGLHGLWLAWTQEVRIDRWAGNVVRLAQKTCRSALEAYDKGGEAR